MFSSHPLISLPLPGVNCRRTGINSRSDITSSECYFSPTNSTGEANWMESSPSQPLRIGQSDYLAGWQNKKDKGIKKRKSWPRPAISHRKNGAQSSFCSASRFCRPRSPPNEEAIRLQIMLLLESESKLTRNLASPRPISVTRIIHRRAP